MKLNVSWNFNLPLRKEQLLRIQVPVGASKANIFSCFFLFLNVWNHLRDFGRLFQFTLRKI